MQVSHEAPPPTFPTKHLFSSVPIKTEELTYLESFPTPPNLADDSRAPLSGHELLDDFDVDVTSYTTNIMEDEFARFLDEEDSDLVMTSSNLTSSTSSLHSLMKPTVMGKRKPKENAQVDD